MTRATWTWSGIAGMGLRSPSKYYAGLPENTWTGSLEPIPPDEATNGTESFDNPPEDARTDVQYGETGGVQGSP